MPDFQNLRRRHFDEVYGKFPMEICTMILPTESFDLSFDMKHT